MEKKSHRFDQIALACTEERNYLGIELQIADYSLNCLLHAFITFGKSNVTAVRYTQLVSLLSLKKKKDKEHVSESIEMIYVFNIAINS